eukprot:TRINITY_DN16808_c0_g4_i1.p1 TRINITY_DN16808_c0_g4~~TRINITY_DN16808_c0_g4_i1.p1  ORF type:complete len:297 (-),score=56.12 TRINITY_DN16808_c0_g4_i1:202-1056(-)
MREAKSQKCDSDDPILRLNVGGKLFTALRSTLCLDSNSMLGKLLADDSPFSPPRLDDDGYIFIDRDGDMFALLLGCLRRGGRLVGEPNDIPTLAKLKLEAEYFGLNDVVRQIKNRRPSSDALKAASLADLVLLELPTDYLLQVGFSADSLKERGVKVRDLLQNNWRGDVLYELGFHLEELAEGGAGAAEVGSKWSRLMLLKHAVGRIVVADDEFGMIDKVKKPNLVSLVEVRSDWVEPKALAMCAEGFVDVTSVNLLVEPATRTRATSRLLDSLSSDDDDDDDW